MLDETLDLGDTSYKLDAVVSHHGDGMEQGHYTCIERRDSGEWVEYNDMRVTSLGFNLSAHAKYLSDAYILIYQLQPPPQQQLPPPPQQQLPPPPPLQLPPSPELQQQAAAVEQVRLAAAAAAKQQIAAAEQAAATAAEQAAATAAEQAAAVVAEQAAAAAVQQATAVTAAEHVEQAALQPPSQPQEHARWHQGGNETTAGMSCMDGGEEDEMLRAEFGDESAAPQPYSNPHNPYPNTYPSPTPQH